MIEIFDEISDEEICQSCRADWEGNEPLNCKIYENTKCCKYINLKVYVAEREYDHEGFSIIGIFLTKEEADFACLKDSGGDSYFVEKFIIGDIPK